MFISLTLTFESPAASDGVLYRITCRANELFERHSYKEAVAEYTRALIKSKPAITETDATDFIALIFANRSGAYCMLRQYEEAYKDAEIVIRLKPEWSKVKSLLGLRRYKEACLSYEKTLILVIGEAQNDVILQLLPGRDIALGTSINPIQNKIFEYATAMKNFIYIIADMVSRLCVVVDACWDAHGVMEVIKREKLRCIGAIVTHYHFDHVGGSPPPPFDQLPIRVSGLATILKKWGNVRAYIHQEDIKYVRESNPCLDPNRIVPTTDDFVLPLGTETQIRFLHTPGHTPGSQCLLVNERRLFSGDTLFLGTCGRLDLPGACKHDMYHSIQEKLTALRDDVVVLPGHNYGGEWTTIGEEKMHGILRPTSKEKWLASR
ncbi:Metallo-hydrolase/oxidoreductase [Basidiobolus meristosporus CBS 931.73]|uniref:Metallo-hydrolase/oxidoreductase n=1 Tax=Basidiobolus meristosporus CBS 931.73 TaxID=1314790 RepID=A0A1Y1X0C8_9FUNG|nr:Metallo-hydrolase/oxidoreductase [Basidiobolus meristosporus CBS 931.73]|eukprot:ORX79279.1 Metallo-hydrolase/oxidoreductase [Basidiobolus meristosporus CBS 931.73]